MYDRGTDPTSRGSQTTLEVFGLIVGTPTLDPPGLPTPLFSTTPQRLWKTMFVARVGSTVGLGSRTPHPWSGGPPPFPWSVWGVVPKNSTVLRPYTSA